MESVSKTVRKLSLTSELVALCHRDVIDPKRGVPAGKVFGDIRARHAGRPKAKA